MYEYRLIIILITLSAYGYQLASANENSMRTECLKQAHNYLKQQDDKLEIKAVQSEQMKNQLVENIIVSLIEACETALDSSLQPYAAFAQFKDNQDKYLDQLALSLQNGSRKGLSDHQRQIIQEYYKIQEQEATYLFGYNLKKLPKIAKVYYFIFYLVVVCLALYSGLKDLQKYSNISKNKKA